MTETKTEPVAGYLAILVLAVAFAAAVLAFGKAYNDCEDSGGVMAQSTGWYQCVEPTNPSR